MTSQIFLWDPDGDTVLDEMVCVDNVAENFGGCMFATGVVNASDAVVMRGNNGRLGGCLCKYRSIRLSGLKYELSCSVGYHRFELLRGMVKPIRDRNTIFFIIRHSPSLRPCCLCFFLCIRSLSPRGSARCFGI